MTSQNALDEDRKKLYDQDMLTNSTLLFDTNYMTSQISVDEDQ